MTIIRHYSQENIGDMKPEKLPAEIDANKINSKLL